MLYRHANISPHVANRSSTPNLAIAAPVMTHQAREELRDPWEPLDGRHADAVAVHGVGKGAALVVVAQQPQHLRQDQCVRSFEDVELIMTR